MKTINNHNSWSKLEEIWLGDVYPVSWYDHLDTKEKDCLTEITEKTKQDLDAIQSKLEEFDIKVRRPVYNQIDDYLIDTEFGPRLAKPQIAPRDRFLAHGNNLYLDNDPNSLSIKPWQHVIDEYATLGENIINSPENVYIPFTGTNTMLVGKDFYIDAFYKSSDTETIETVIEDFRKFRYNVKEYRTRLTFHGGRFREQYFPVKPGLVLSYSNSMGYKQIFNNWHCIDFSHPKFKVNAPQYPNNEPLFNGKWDLEIAEPISKSFNSLVIDHALSWASTYHTTYSDIDGISIDENNILLLGTNSALADELSKHNITVHSVPFRTKRFWDSSLRSLAVDIRRQSTVEDFFPDRIATQKYEYPNANKTVKYINK
jgi:hypothetical protein